MLYLNNAERALKALKTQINEFRLTDHPLVNGAQSDKGLSDIHANTWDLLEAVTSFLESTPTRSVRALARNWDTPVKRLQSWSVTRGQDIVPMDDAGTDGEVDDLRRLVHSQHTQLVELRAQMQDLTARVSRSR